jgi:cob(I)alamin adenosyltransferase
MVVLNRIYTRTGDDGTTGLSTGARVAKFDRRVAAFGTVDETNAAVGLARLHGGEAADVDAMLERVQHDLFDLGADLCTPETGRDLGWEPLRITQSQVDRIEREIDALNADLPSLRSFVLPGGSPLAAHLHLCRTVCRRAERLMVELAAEPGETVSGEALRFINRLSDFFFVASRAVNARGAGDVLWVKGRNR